MWRARNLPDARNLPVIREPGRGGRSLSDLGDVYLTMGRLDDAQGCLRASLTIWRAHGERYGQAATLGRLGRAQKQAGRPAEARELLSEAHFILTELGDLGQAAEVEAELAELTVAAPLLCAVYNVTLCSSIRIFLASIIRRPRARP